MISDECNCREELGMPDYWVCDICETGRRNQTPTHNNINTKEDWFEEHMGDPVRLWELDGMELEDFLNNPKELRFQKFTANDVKQELTRRSP